MQVSLECCNCKRDWAGDFTEVPDDWILWFDGGIRFDFCDASCYANFVIESASKRAHELDGMEARAGEER